MTFRSGKRHRVQESHTSKSVQKLASKLQLFTKNVKVSQSDLRAVDARLITLLMDRAERVSQLLDRLKDSVPYARSKEFAKICHAWSEWVTEIDGKESRGYSKVEAGNSSGGVLIENIFDMDSDLFNMLFAFESSISEMVAKSSYQVPDLENMKQNTDEIIALFNSRQKALESLA